SSTFSAIITPTTSSNLAAALNITDNSGGSPKKVSLMGTWIEPMPILNPSSLFFGNQSVGTTSGAKGIQLKNTGNSTLTISSIARSEASRAGKKQSNRWAAARERGEQVNTNGKFSQSE